MPCLSYLDGMATNKVFNWSGLYKIDTTPIVFDGRNYYDPVNLNKALPITQLGMVSDLKFYTYGISRQRDYI